MEKHSTTMLRLAGLLLLCVCGEGSADMDITQSGECPEQVDAAGGLRDGRCSLNETFKSATHHCKLYLPVQCPGGAKYVSQHSNCLSKLENVRFTCEERLWIRQEVQENSARSKRRWRSRVRIRVGIRNPVRRIQLKSFWGSRRRYSCGWWSRSRCRRPAPPTPAPVVNKPPVFTRCPGPHIVIAAKGKTTGTASWATPAATDPENQAIKLDRISGQDSGTTFSEGNTQIGYRARDSHGADSYCWFKVSVTVIRCYPGPRFIEHATYSCTGPEENLYGSVCTYSCKEGYEIGTNKTMTCQQDRQWSNAVPTCSPVSCGDPGAITSGSYSCPGSDPHVFPKVCYVTCDAGFRQPSGSPFILCTETGQWTSTTACRDAEAPKLLNGCPPNMNLVAGPLEQPVTVTWDDPAVSDSSNYTLTSSLTKGSALPPGFHVIRLTATDAMGLSASCNFVVNVAVKRCDYPHLSANSRLSNCTHSYVEGSRCTVTCEPGYDLQGTNFLTCLVTEKWDVTTPSCTAVSCGTPPLVQFGSFVGASFRYPTVRTLDCDSSSNLEGERYLRCQVNGKWSQPGTCVDKQPPSFPQDCPDNKEVFAASLGQPTLVDWNPPTTEDNSGQSVTLVSSVAPGSPFPLGATTVTYTATDTQGNAASCSFTVTVTTLTCGSLTQTTSSSGSLRYTCPNKNVVGATCTPRCADGATLRGADNITCQRDDSTFPPTVEWGWATGASSPECIASACSTDLPAPEHGALGCYQGNFAKECLLSCEEQWDIPASDAHNGRFVCPNSGDNKGLWSPSAVQGCTARVLPGRVRYLSDLYYFTGSCANATQTIQQTVIQRLKSSGWSNGCATTASCVAENIEVTCSAARRKRSTHNISKKSTHYYRVSFQLAMLYQEGSSSAKATYQRYKALAAAIFAILAEEADSGHFNVGTLTTDRYSINSLTMTADCPPGTLFKNTGQTTRVSCVGCYRGHFLAPGAASCQKCPVGSYTPLDDATACTPCPTGWSTPSTGSTNSSDCQEMCRAGQFSDDGFVPCQPCPPGQYQSRERGVTCDPCPASTWTNGSATGLHQCVPADAHLSPGMSLTARAPTSLTALTLTSLFHLSDLAAVNATFTFAGSNHNPVYVYLYTQGSATVPGNSGTSVSAVVKVKTWTSLVLTSDASGGQTSVTLNNSVIFTRAPPPSPSLPAVNLTVATLEGKVVVSGLFGEEATVAATTPGVSGADCNGNTSTNRLTWSLPPASLRSPSLCDAVDACLSSPCSSSHGQCEDRQGGYLCRCRDGWSGPTCRLPPDACYLHQCQNAATCLAEGASSQTCVCAQGFSGERCDLVKVSGGHGEWSPWSNCSATCEGQQHRQRLCDNPAPLNGGDNCTGPWSQTESCGESHCPEDGGWSAWAPWSPCSAACGVGERVRRRICDNPAPRYGGEQCPGGAEEREACNYVQCPVNGIWGEWSTWPECSVTCGGGTRSRDRSCDRPAPANDGALCVGATNETEACGQRPCPVCSKLLRKTNNQIECDDWKKPTPDPVTCNVTCADGFATSVDFPLYRCGSTTNHLWNTQLNATSPVILPVCSEPTPPLGTRLTMSVPLQTGCDVSTDDVSKGVTENLQQLPCNQSDCVATVTTECQASGGEGRRRRSAGTLVAVLSLNIDFGDAATPANGSDPAAIQKYEDAFSLAEDLVEQISQNLTGSLFTISINGKVVQPDLTSVTYNTSMLCPAGSTSVSSYCVPCSPGTKGEGGQCALCPVGQYQDTPGSTACKACPDGLTYDLPGASNVLQCVFPAERSRRRGKDSAMSDGLVIVLVLAVVAILFIVLLAVFLMKLKGRPVWFTPVRPLSAKVSPDQSRPCTSRSVKFDFDGGPEKETET